MTKHGFLLTGSAILALMACLACATSKEGSQRSEGYYVITHEEIVTALERRPMQNALEIIEFLRPRFLKARRQQSVTLGSVQAEPVVYVNGVRFGRSAELRNIPYNQVGRVEYLKSSEATQRFGFGHEGGAILITAN